MNILIFSDSELKVILLLLGILLLVLGVYINCILLFSIKILLTMCIWCYIVCT